MAIEPLFPWPPGPPKASCAPAGPPHAVQEASTAEAPSPLTALARCPDEILLACVQQLAPLKVAQLARNLHRACQTPLAPPGALRLRWAADFACRTNVRQADGLGLHEKDAFAWFAHAWPKAGSMAWSDTLIEREQLRQRAVGMHEAWVRDDALYAYWGTHRAAELGASAISFGNTLMVLAYEVLADAYVTKPSAGGGLDAEGARAAWLAGTRGPAWARAAGRNALLYFSLLPEADKVSTLGHCIRATSLAYLNEPERALQSFVQARRTHRTWMQRPYADRNIPEYVGRSLLPSRPAHHDHRWQVADVEVKLELLKQSTCISGSASLLRFFAAWRNEVSQRQQTVNRGYILGVDDLTEWVVLGRNSALRAYVELNEEAVAESRWVRKMVAALSRWKQTSADGASRASEQLLWQRQIDALSAILLPFAAENNVSNRSIASPGQ